MLDLLRRISDFPADFVDLSQHFGRQRRAVGVNAFVQLRQGAHANDGAGDLPFGVAKRQGHLCRRHAVGDGQRVVAARGDERIWATPALFAHGFKHG